MDAITEDHLDELARKAESGADWAEICRLEAVANGGPFWCPTCNVQLSDADTSPCKLEYGVKCGVEILGLDKPSEPAGKPLTAYSPQSRPAISDARARLAARMPPLLAAMKDALAQYSRDVRAHEHQRDHDEQRNGDWTR